MPERIYVKTEELVGIIDTKLVNILSIANKIRDTWTGNKTINSFSEYLALDKTTKDASRAIQDCYDVVKKLKGN
jgi:uncharacterized protein YukE